MTLTLRPAVLIEYVDRAGRLQRGTVVSVEVSGLPDPLTGAGPMTLPRIERIVAYGPTGEHSFCGPVEEAHAVWPADDAGFERIRKSIGL